jgi:hypothetical protein
MDNECKLGVYQIDFVTGEVPAAAEEEADDDLALSNIDMDDLEDQLDATQDKAAAVIEPAAPITEVQAQPVADIINPEPEFVEHPVKSQQSLVQSEKRVVKFQHGCFGLTKASCVRYAPSSKEVDYVRPVHNMGKALDDIVQITPQLSFMPNCKYDEADKDVDGEITLHWSLMGTIQRRKNAVMNYTSLDIEFSDRNFHRNLRINDDFNSCMAIMNYTGLVTASKRIQINEDEYEDDLAENKDNEIDKKYSYIYFKPFDERKQSYKNGWHFKMQDHESIEAIAQGS